MYTLNATFALSQILSILFNAQNVDEITESSFLCLSIMSACLKVLNLLLKRNDLIELTNTLLGGLYKYRDDDEEKIQRKFDSTARFNTIVYSGMISLSAVMVTLQSLFNTVPERRLPFPSWHPYNYTRRTDVYVASYFHQLMGNITSAFLHVGSDTLVTGMMIQICAQLEILQCRMKKLPDGLRSENARRMCLEKRRYRQPEELGDIIRHHDCIYRFCKIFNATFSMMMVTQFLIAALVTGSSVFQLSKMQLFSSRFFTLLSYLICVVAQIFLYCWYGDAVSTQSVNVSSITLDVDWTHLDSETKKSLLVMMARSRKPIEMKTGWIIHLSMSSFAKIMKTSYSAFNFMQRMA
ncbi:odorant receptor 67c-like [Copidosoma floridanum]|uniref:odorant receptor 67c-like n=1 Tax=Copidosoma floridanum TaxID=29053 RepID=UPI000C6F9D26|nr:odorant receptor 67c-like [Copidosoma floridanum]